MLAIFSKPISDLTPEDVHQLLSEEACEGEALELKERLPDKNGLNSWENKREISSYARRELMAEVVAFANSQGGHLILGVRESNNHPKRAAGLVPLPDCADLAHRLALQARDCIEPPIPLLQIGSIMLDGDGSGLVVLRIERSYRAPHRLRTDLNCYYRRDDRTETMTMREIQDLTLQIDRGTNRIDRIFERHRDSLQTWVEQRPTRGSALRISICPIWPLRVQKLRDDASIFPPLRPFMLQIDRHAPFPIQSPSTPQSRPIVRGWCRFSSQNEIDVMQSMLDDGTGEIRLWVDIQDQTQYCIYPHWVLANYASAIQMAHAFRTSAGSPTAEFALEWEIYSSAPVGLVPFWNRGFLSPLGLVKPMVFPRSSIAGPEEWNFLIQQAAADLYAAAGSESPSGTYTLNW